VIYSDYLFNERCVGRNDDLMLTWSFATICSREQKRQRKSPSPLSPSQQLGWRLTGNRRDQVRQSASVKILTWYFHIRSNMKNFKIDLPKLRSHDRILSMALVDPLIVPTSACDICKIVFEVLFQKSRSSDHVLSFFLFFFFFYT
jgi:hypothetical protein